MKVAFLGLGTMGASMARNVLRNGHAVTVWNRTAARTEPLVAAGAARAATPSECAREAEVVLLMLSDPAAVNAVVFGESGVLAGLAPGAVLVDLSTVDPESARRTDQAVRARGGLYLDAPVSGSRKPAEDGTLVIMAGGPDDALALARPVLETMGRVVRVGAVGQGMAMKLVLNGLGAHMLTGFVSLLVLGARQGLAPRTMLEVISAGAFSSPLYTNKGERILARDFRPDFSLALMLKDQELVLSAARELGVDLSVLAAIRDVLSHAVSEGLGGDDFSGLIRHFEQAAGVTVAAK